MSTQELVWKESEENLKIETNKPMKKFLTQKKYFFPAALAFTATVLQIFLLKSCSFQDSHASSPKKYAVIFSNNDIKKGETIGEKNTKIVYLDIADNTSSFILNSEFLKYQERPLKIDLSKNSPLLKDVVASTQELKNSLPEQIPYGKRFFGIEIDTSDLPSLIKIGDRVDIVAHMDIEGFGKATHTILNAVKVIGVDNDINANSLHTESHLLNFYLTPEEVKIISFMKPYSQFSVSLRNPNDVEASDDSSVTFNQFIQDEKIQKIFRKESFQIIDGKSIKASH